MPWCATLHSTLWDIYTGVEGNTDTRGEDVIIKYMWSELPSHWECYDISKLTTAEAKTAKEIVNEVCDTLETLMDKIGVLNNEADNNLSEIIWPIWNTFTGYCAAIQREMCEEEDDMEIE